MSTNTNRILNATKMVDMFYNTEGQNLQESLTDLLTDLRHYTTERGVDFHKALDMSYQHYLAEKAGQ